MSALVCAFDTDYMFINILIKKYVLFLHTENETQNLRYIMRKVTGPHNRRIYESLSVGLYSVL